MELTDVVAMGGEFFQMALLLAAPVVVVSLSVGLIISIGQTVTSVQEQTLAFAPRIVAVVFVMMYLSNWYLITLKTYTVNIFSKMVELIQ